MDALKSGIEDTAIHSSALKAGTRRRWLIQLVGVVISFFCLWTMLRQIQFNELKSALLGAHWKWIGLGIASLALGYVFRIYRWAVMLRSAGVTLTNRQCAAPFLGSIALNNVLPFRVGDIVRAFVFPAAMGMDRATATASLMLERVIDLFTLLLIMGAGLYLSALLSFPAWVGKTLFIFSGLGCVLLFFILLFGEPLLNFLDQLTKKVSYKPRSILTLGLNTAWVFFNSLRQMCRVKPLLLIFLISMLVWMGETGLFFAILQSLDISIGLSCAWLIMAVATLSTLVPSSPGYVGPFHLAIFSVMSMLGGTSMQAVSFAVLVHLGLWVPSTLAGSLALLMNPRLFKKINQ